VVVNFPRGKANTGSTEIIAAEVRADRPAWVRFPYCMYLVVATVILPISIHRDQTVRLPGRYSSPQSLAWQPQGLAQPLSCPLPRHGREPGLIGGEGRGGIFSVNLLEIENPGLHNHNRDKTT
jgi:hypothetical protein